MNVSPVASSRKQTEAGAPTVTENEHVTELPAASDAVQVTVVEPMGKNDPDAGTHATVTAPQLSEAAGAGKLIAAPISHP